MKVIIDRFEGSFAVCETEKKEMINIDIKKLPYGCKEGDVLDIENGLNSIDKSGTDEQKAKIEKLCEGLWE